MIRIIIAAVRHELERQRRAQFILAAGPRAEPSAQDWRITARHRTTKAFITAYATSRPEAANDVKFLRGAGYRNVRMICYD